MLFWTEYAWPLQHGATTGKYHGDLILKLCQIRGKWSDISLSASSVRTSPSIRHIACFTAKTNGSHFISGSTSNITSTCTLSALQVKMRIRWSLCLAITTHRSLVYFCLGRDATFGLWCNGALFEFWKLMMDTVDMNFHGVHSVSSHLELTLPITTSTTPKTSATTQASWPFGTLFLIRTKTFTKLIQKVQEVNLTTKKLPRDILKIDLICKNYFILKFIDHF